MVVGNRIRMKFRDKEGRAISLVSHLATTF
jgi:hypothetical protein